MQPTAAAPLVVRRVVAMEDGGPGSSDVYERWRDETGLQVTRRYDVKRGAGPFRANSTRWEMPGASLAQFDYSGMTYTRTAAHIRNDESDTVAVQLTHVGGLRASFGDREVTAGPGTAIFLSWGRPSEHVTPRSQGRLFYLPRSTFGDMGTDAMHGRVVSGAAYARLDSYFSWLVEALPRGRASAVERVHVAMAAVVRATFDSRAEPELEASGALDDLLVQRLRRLVAARAAEPGLDAEFLAAALGVSRAPLYRAAKPFGGVMELVWATRLDAASAALTNSDRRRTIGEIAAEHGFSTEPHFTRRFRARYGFNPSDLRPRLG